MTDKGDKILETPVIHDDPIETPEQHARARGLLRRSRNGGTLRCADYRAAATLHGWTVHCLHTASPLMITRSAFDAAIAAARNPNERGEYTPAPEASSPFNPFARQL
jgi:hypothetical protein